jgi:hypothetical protein
MICYIHKLWDLTLSGASVVRAAAVLVLLTLRNNKYKGGSDLECHDIHTNLYDNPSVVSEVTNKGMRHGATLHYEKRKVVKNNLSFKSI